MKPESRHALMELISYGVEELSSEEATHLLAVIHECPECTGQWVLFEKTYTVLSQSGETEISVERSHQMWLACVEHAHHNQRKLQLHTQQSGVVPVSFRSDSSQREGDRRNPSSPSAWLQTLKNKVGYALTPRLTYALTGGAFALLATAFLASPTPPASSTTTNPRIALPYALQSPNFAASSTFVAPPHATTGMIDYHAAMGFEPFSDHLAPTLVSSVANLP